METRKVVCISNTAWVPNLNVDVTPHANQSLIDMVIGKTHEVLQERDGWYQLVDGSGEDYWYPASMFEPA